MSKIDDLREHLQRQTDVVRTKIMIRNPEAINPWVVRATIVCPFTKTRRLCYYNDAGTLIETEYI